MEVTVNITEQELKDLTSIRNYFGEHDKTSFEQFSFLFLNNLYKKLSSPEPKTIHFVFNTSNQVFVFDENYHNIPELQGELTAELYNKIKALSSDKTIWKGFEELK